jgi:hypothetical protein
MISRMTKRILVTFLALNLLAAGVGQTAIAAMIGTQDVLSSEQHAELLVQVRGDLARDDVRSQFLSLGVDPLHIDQRLDQLTEQELVQLSDRIDEMPAGAGLGALGVVLVVLIVLELLGVINIFKRI